MTIHLLTPDTIGKIAAGEVVERPVSVVKELLENALDAGSRRISIEIRGGGVELIEMADDGIGISADELSLAVQRHATSKLTRFTDLNQLTTLGFRGEALPSIAAVSMLTIRSRTAEDSTGAALDITFGDLGQVRPVAGSMGTTVTVRELFGNVPARRKFLRQPTTENGYISRVVAAYAAAYPAVQFTLISDGRRILGTDGQGNVLSAVTGAYGVDVGQTALELQPLDEVAAVPGVSVSGWITAPTVSRSHRQEMAFLVNGRLIQHRALSYALEEAYHSLLMVGRHPIAVVHIEVEPDTVDVNVHPTKAEVKFVDERTVCRAVQRAAHVALAGAPHDELPEVSFGPIETPQPRRQTLWKPPVMGSSFSPSIPAEPITPIEQIVPTPTIPILRVLGQVSATYIIAEGPEGMYLIDQHAAHERVMYEKILGQMRRGAVERQPLLDPLVIELDPEEHAAFERSWDELTQIGFDIEPFGDGTVAVRAIPALMRDVDIGERLGEILRELADGGSGESWLDSVAISAACHTSIRAGQALSLPEMRALIAELEQTSQPRACGHGRPTMLHLTQTDLERQFSRR